ncbi:hypothetical protein ACGH7X_38575 [Streptomyces sp. BBFR51]|uniref:hypothetical protein n=1 Tax=Streptomyces sp. BBFR51 TaxID=3372856 RepID=UPI0037DCA3BE
MTAIAERSQDPAVELLSGVMRAGAERIGRDPAAIAQSVRSARDIILASLVGVWRRTGPLTDCRLDEPVVTSGDESFPW